MRMPPPRGCSAAGRHCDALEKIARDPVSLDVNPVSAPMYIVKPARGPGSGKHVLDHPPVGERVRRLRAYDPEA
jgi:Zn-dependent protease with chaperone function